jgi:hypothetical protein
MTILTATSSTFRLILEIVTRFPFYELDGRIRSFDGIVIGLFCSSRVDAQLVGRELNIMLSTIDLSRQNTS